MSSISWKEYLTEVVTTFRKQVDKLDPESQKRIRKVFRHNLLFEPCQIEVIDLKTEGFVVFLVSHDRKLPDMTFEIHENAKSINESNFLKKYKYEMIKHWGFLPLFQFGRMLNEHWLIVMENSVSIKKEMSSQKLADYIFGDVIEELKNTQVDVIEQTTSGLKKSISKIPEKETREELLANTSKIGGALKEIKRLDEEIGKVRRLVGVTKEIQDWKLLISDVDRLKGEHIPREVFESRLEGLTTKIEAFEKIEKAYERLASQQEKVLKQQSGFLKWIKYSIILVPIAVACVPIIETLIHHFLGP